MLLDPSGANTARGWSPRWADFQPEDREQAL